MYGLSPGFPVPVNAEFKSMGGVVECGHDVDTKTSPHHAAFEKAQAELQQEFDIREERRRELEFLEKGGNPLDFKFLHGAAVSVQSTSLTDQHADLYVTSEAKGSFTLAASPHGDSVESSGRPGGSIGREANIGDNLLLLDGENTKLHGERSAKHRGKRGSVALLEQVSHVDGCNNVKGTDDSVIFRLGAKSQAYARRNRTRTSRDSANLTLTDLASRHANRASITSSSIPGSSDVKESLTRLAVQDHAVASNSNSMAGNPDVDFKERTLVADDRVGKSLAMVHKSNVKTESTDMTIDALPEGGKDVNTTETSPGIDPFNQPSSIAEKAPKGAFNDGSLPAGQVSTPLESNESKEINDAGNDNESGVPDKTMTNFDENDPSYEKSVEGRSKRNCTADATSNFFLTNSTCNINSIDGDQSFMPSDGMPCGEFIDQSTFKESMSDKPLKDNDLFKSDVVNDTNDASKSIQQDLSNSAVQMKDETCDSKIRMLSEVVPVTNSEPMKLNEEIIYETDVKSNNSLSDSSCIGKDGASLLTSPASDSPKTILVKLSTASETIDLQISTADQKKAHEEAILEEARLIEARLKRAGELSTSNTHFEKQRKCHWDFVLEEMAWMANDFMQERLWKTAAASQVSRLIASCGRAKFEQANILRMRKNATNSLANSVIHFWHEAEVICMNDKASNAMHHECKSDRLGLLNAKKTEVEAGQHPRTVLDYAVRFLKHNDSAGCHSVLGELPATPSCQNGSRILEIPYEDQLSEVWGSLYYTVPARAMRAYRESMESQWMYYKKLGNSMHQDDCETSICNSVSGGPRENAYEEDEGETGTYLFAENFETGLPSKHSHKKRKDIIQKSNATRVSEGGYFSYEPEGKLGNQPFVLNGKRNSSTFNVGSFPTRRVRTSSRQRIVTPYPPGSTAPLQMTSKTDASSEDTSSFLGDQSSLHRGSVPRKNPGFETTVDFERKFPFDNNEISSKSKKKKKKPKHLGYKNSLNLDDRSLLVTAGRGSMQGSFYEQRLQADTMIHQEQKEHVKKRLESQNYDSNGGTVIYGQHAAKKPKLLKQLSEASAEALVPVSGSLPSPVASQMSNMSNSNKLIKIIANRDRARKNKALKMAAGQSGSGSPWSNFEDQALVVLVHDMGPNWELVSDAINNTLKFKCIFRKPKECKERHKFLMDKSAGDGADSAEDSGSSQPYPSSLPGIPKGSARQLFQRLQGPMEEDILKTHFEKIILLGQKLSSCIRQIDNQDSKQITAAHNSHVVALKQVCPNNLNRGILTPLDFCESFSSSPEAFSLAYQGPHAGGLAVPSHQGSMPPSPILPPSSSTMLQGPTGMVLSSTLPSASTSSNPSPRDSQRYTVPRPSAVPVDDPQRLQQYNQILSGRTLQQSNTTLPGALPLGVDRGVRMLPVASGMGMMPGGNRGMPMSRPAFQGIGSPSMLNMVSSGNMMSSGHGMQNTVNVHPNAVSSQGNSIMRPRDPLQVLRPGQNPEEHRQMMMQELQMQASQPNGQSAPPFNGISAAFSNATIPTAIQTFQVQQHQQSHQMLQPSHMLGNPHHHQIQGANLSGTQQQAYAMRAAKERQLHQRMMPQPQHHISGSNTVSSAQSNSQIQPQSQSCSSVTPVSSVQGQHKQPNAARNLPPGMSSQITKPKQRPQVQINQSRQQQQRQQPQQQAKLMKGPGRGGMLIHHNLSADASQVSGFSTASKIQVSDKHMVQQSQGFYPGNSGLNSTLHQPGNQTNIYPHSLPQSTKQMSPVSDSCNQGSAQSSPNMLTQQAPSVALPKQHQQPQPRYFNQSQQGTQRIVLQHNRHMNSDGKLQSSTDQSPYPKGATSASVAPCNDSGPSATLGSSATLWNPEASFDTNAPTPTAHVSSAQESVLGSEPLLPSSGQGLLPHQLPGGVTLHGHNIGGQRRQQQQQQQQQQQKQPPSPPPQQQKQQPQHQKEPLHSRQSDLGAG